MTNNLFPGLTLNTEDIVLDITVSSVSAVDPEPAVKIYPNPTTGMIYIHLAPEMKDSEITVYAVTGNRLYTKKLMKSGETTLDLSYLNQGVYVLRITGIGISESKLIILKK